MGFPQVQPQSKCSSLQNAPSWLMRRQTGQTGDKELPPPVSWTPLASKAVLYRYTLYVGRSQQFVFFTKEYLSLPFPSSFFLLIPGTCWAGASVCSLSLRPALLGRLPPFAPSQRHSSREDNPVGGVGRKQVSLAFPGLTQGWLGWVTEARSWVDLAEGLPRFCSWVCLSGSGRMVAPSPSLVAGKGSPHKGG